MMNQPRNVFSCSVRSPLARLTFPHLEKKNEGGQYPSNKYEATLLFPRETSDFKILKGICGTVARQKWLDGVDLKTVKFPFRNGDEHKYDSFHGHVYIKAKNGNQPQFYGPAKEPFTPDAFYAGCYVYASLSAMTYEAAGQKGVSFLLNGLQFVKNGERFGTLSVEGDFEIIADQEVPATPVENGSATMQEQMYQPPEPLAVDAQDAYDDIPF